MEDLGSVPSPLETMQSMGFDYSMAAIMAGTFFGLVGLYLFRRGKRESHMPNVIVGICLMVFPIFVSSALYTWVIGILLCGVAYYYWPFY